MSLNLGNAAIDGARALAGVQNEHWTALRAAVLEAARQKMNQALESAPELRADATGYARALRDLHIAFESASTGVPAQRVTKPGTEKPHA